IIGGERGWESHLRINLCIRTGWLCYSLHVFRSSGLHVYKSLKSVKSVKSIKSIKSCSLAVMQSCGLAGLGNVSMIDLPSLLRSGGTDVSC
ncbi:MAG: hypothetical protein ACM3NR_01225, partial [Methanosarcina sp.]